RTELSVDGNQLARGNGPGGPLAEVRLATESKGKDTPPKDLAVVLDDLRLARRIEPVGGVEVEPDQDEVRLVGGDQVFGRVASADPAKVELSSLGRSVAIPWSIVGGIYFRRAPATSSPVEGWLVRVEWRTSPGNDPRDLDRVEGALKAVGAAEVTL